MNWVGVIKTHDDHYHFCYVSHMVSKFQQTGDPIYQIKLPKLVALSNKN